MRLRQETFKQIERELYDYHDTRKRCNEIVTNIIYSSPAKYEVRGHDISDPTFDAASKIVCSKQRIRMIEIICAIDVSFMILKPKRYEVLKDKYFLQKNLTWTQIAELHTVDRKTLYNWRTVFVISIAKQLGLK